MKNYLPILLLLSSLSAFGQSFWQEDFSNGFPTDWTTEDLMPDNILWDYCDGNSCNLFASDFRSETASNGFMIIRPPIDIAFKSVLTTPPIDCSDKETVVLEFETFIQTEKTGAAEGYLLFVKNENEDWLQFDILPQQSADTIQRSRNAERMSIDISEIAAMNSAVEIRWEWTGIREGELALDDVKIYDHEPYYDRVVWGNEPGQGDFDGGLNGWRVQTRLPFNHPTFKWEWEEFGSVAKAFSISSLRRFDEFRNFPYINSYSNENGAMVFNADFFTTNGTAPPTGTPQNYIAELVSPIIDLSDVTGEVNLRFEQLVMVGGMAPNFPIPSITFLSFSTDGGQTYGSPIAVNDELIFDRIRESQETISICGAAGAAEFRMKFTFHGQFYFWAVDDIVLVEKPEFDLQIKPNFFSVAPNLKTPASQVEPLFFLVDIENFGSERQEVVELSVAVTDLSTNQVVYEESKILETIDQCELKGNEIFGRFSPPEIPTEYEVKYTVESNGVDSTPEDNELSWNFEISERTFSKENGSTTGIQPNTRNAGYVYGNVFYLENGNGFKIDSLTFGLHDPVTSTGAKLNLFIYRFFGDANGDALVDPDERELVGVANYEVNGSEHLTSEGLVTVEILNIDSLEQVGVDTEDGAYYLATVEYSNDSNINCPLQASQAIDYTATFFMYDSLNLPRYAGLDLFTVDQFELLNLINLIPVIRINLADRAVSVADIKEQPLLIQPNPIKDQFELLSKPTKPTDILELYDLKGKLLKSWNANDSDFSIEEFSKGVYFLKMKTTDSVFVGKVVKG